MMDGNSVSPFELPAHQLTLAYLRKLAEVGAFYVLLHIFWGKYVLLDFSDITGNGLSAEGLGNVWFIFAWGLAGTLALTAISRPVVYESKSVLLGRSLWLSLNAGVFEELIYRWLLFFTAMIVLPFFNFITFGLVEWIYGTLLIPLANLVTFHALEPWLLHQGSWVFGAALLSANVDFRDAHGYQGLIGWVNSWFIGMGMFYLLLNYGLLTAMAAHVIYDVIVLTIKSLASTQPGFRLNPRKLYRI